MSLLAPVRRVGVGGALLGCGAGKVLLDLMTGLESLLAAAGRQRVFDRKTTSARLFFRRKFSKRKANSYPLYLFNGSKWALCSSSQGAKHRHA